MKDPLGIMGTETIFVMEGWTGNNVLEEFENMDMFKAGIPRKKYILPYNWDGTGGVVYGPYLYYNRYKTLYLNKMNNDLEVAHPQSGSSSTWFLVELVFGNVGFWGEGKTGVPGEKPLGAKERTNNKLNPHMASTPGFQPGPSLAPRYNILLIWSSIANGKTRV